MDKLIIVMGQVLLINIPKIIRQLAQERNPYLLQLIHIYSFLLQMIIQFKELNKLMGLLHLIIFLSIKMIYKDQQMLA